MRRPLLALLVRRRFFAELRRLLIDGLSECSPYSIGRLVAGPANRGGNQVKSGGPSNRRIGKKSVRATPAANETFDGAQYSLTHPPPSFLEPHKLFPGPEPEPVQPATLFPREIVAHLDQVVVGQKDAKRALAVGVYQHYKRLDNNEKALHKWIFDEMELARSSEHEEERRPLRQKSQRQIAQEIAQRHEVLLEKSNIVLMGPSGTGKTFVTQKLAEILDVPLVVCDCTTLTQAGYVGDDVDTIIQKLFEASDYDPDRCQRGIVFLDEFDKLYTSYDPLHTSGNRDVGGKGVQQALLKLVEGTTLRIKDPLQPKRKVEIDTTNILFIASGAFSNIERVVARRVDRKTLGFGARARSSNDELLDDDDERVSAKVKDDLLKLCDQGDLIQYGMIPELVGRFPVLVPFHSLSEEQLVAVLSKPKGNLVAQAKRFFEIEEIKLTITDCALEEMARLAVQRKTGARALKSILERTLLEAKFELPGSEARAAKITAETVRSKQFTAE